MMDFLVMKKYRCFDITQVGIQQSTKKLTTKKHHEIYKPLTCDFKKKKISAEKGSIIFNNEMKSKIIILITNNLIISQ